MEVFEPLDETQEEVTIHTGEGRRKRPAEGSASQSKKLKVPLTPKAIDRSLTRSGFMRLTQIFLAF